MKSDYKEYLDFAKDLALKSGEILLRFRGKAQITTTKSSQFDFATEADIAVNDFIIREIKKKYPTHGILSEESSEDVGSSPYRWVIDPLDGTWNYSVGLPDFGTIIGFEYGTETIVGVFNLPVTKELFYTAKGFGAYLNNRQIHVNSQNQLNASFVYINHPSFKTPPDLFDFKIELLKKLTLSSYRCYPTHASSLDLLRIAQGSFEGYISSGSFAHWWDLIASMFLIEEAGGKVATYKGEKVTEENFFDGFIASNGKIHDKLLKLIEEIK